MGLCQGPSSIQAVCNGCCCEPGMTAMADVIEADSTQLTILLVTGCALYACLLARAVETSAVVVVPVAGTFFAAQCSVLPPIVDLRGWPAGMASNR